MAEGPVLDSALDPNDLIRRGLLPLRPANPQIPPLTMLPRPTVPVGTPSLATPPPAAATGILKAPLAATPRVQAPVQMPDPNDPQYRMIVPGSKLKSGLTGLLAGLSQGAGIPTKNGIEPLEGLRQIGQNVLAAPGERLKAATEAARGALDTQEKQTNIAHTQAETEALGNKPGGEKADVIETSVGPLQFDPETKQWAHVSVGGQEVGAKPKEITAGNEPANLKDVQSLKDGITASQIPPAEKTALLGGIRDGMTTKELDSLSARYEGAAGRFSSEDISEKNRRADRANAAAEKNAAKDEEPIIAFDPKTKERIYTTRGDAKTSGYTMAGGKAASEADIAKESAKTSQFDDVQMNVSRYKTTYAALKGPLSSSDVNNMTAILSLIQSIERPGEGGFVGSLSAGYVPALANSAQRQTLGAAWSKLSPEAAELVTGYLRAKGAIPAYQRALTGVGRTSKEAMEIEMANLPEPTVGYTKANSQLKAFQENIDVASKGLVKFPWLDSPQEIRKNIEGAATTLPAGAIPGTMNGKHGYVLNGKFNAE